MIGHRPQVGNPFLGVRFIGDELRYRSVDRVPRAAHLSTLNYQPSLAEQLFDAVNQPSDGERFDQVLHVMLGEEKRYFRVGGEAGNENEAICQRWTDLFGFKVELVSAQARHLQVADDRVVLMRFDLEEGFLAVKRDVHEEIFVCQDPLQS